MDAKAAQPTPGRRFSGATLGELHRVDDRGGQLWWRRKRRVREIEELQHGVGKGVPVGQRREAEADFNETQDRRVVVDDVGYEVGLGEGGNNRRRDPEAGGAESPRGTPRL